MNKIFQDKKVEIKSINKTQTERNLEIKILRTQTRTTETWNLVTMSDLDRKYNKLLVYCKMRQKKKRKTDVSYYYSKICQQCGDESWLDSPLLMSTQVTKKISTLSSTVFIWTREMTIVAWGKDYEHISSKYLFGIWKDWRALIVL